MTAIPPTIAGQIKHGYNIMCKIIDERAEKGKEPVKLCMNIHGHNIYAAPVALSKKDQANDGS